MCFQWKFATKQKDNSCRWDWNNFRGRTRTNVQVGAVYVRPYEEILTRISRKSKLLRWEQENIATLWRGKTFYSVILACPKLHRLFCVTFFISSGNSYQLHKISEKCVGFKRQKIWVLPKIWSEFSKFRSLPAEFWQKCWKKPYL